MINKKYIKASNVLKNVKPVDVNISIIMIYSIYSNRMLFSNTLFLAEKYTSNTKALHKQPYPNLSYTILCLQVKLT